jgi:hypothetical protein
MSHDFSTDDERLHFTAYAGPAGKPMAGVILTPEGLESLATQMPAELLDQLCLRWLAHRMWSLKGQEPLHAREQCSYPDGGCTNCEDLQ